MATNLTRWSPFGSFTSEEPFGGMLSLRNAMDRLCPGRFRAAVGALRMEWLR